MFSAVERLANINRSLVALDAGRCLHVHDRMVVCERCYQVCPAGAISEGKPPSLQGEKCSACLACLPVCPTGALSADDAVQMLFDTVVRLEGDSIELLCEKHPQPENGFDESTGIRVRGCLAGLGSGTLIALIALGQKRVRLRTDACNACEWAVLGSSVDSQVNAARSILQAWEQKELISCEPSLENSSVRPFWDSQNPPLSRRDLFRMLSKQGQIALARAMEEDVTPSGRKPGRDRLRLLSAVSHLPEFSTDKDFCLDGVDFATVTVSETCTACGTCARACPTGAMQFLKNDENMAFALLVENRLCIGCDICSHVCLPGSLHIDRTTTFMEIFVTEKVTLREGELSKCSQCGSFMAKRAESNLCSLCEYRRKHKFGSVLPPGLQNLRSADRKRST
jgi:Fe-S-cluster-containing hydrogenase component 2